MTQQTTLERIGEIIRDVMERDSYGIIIDYDVDTAAQAIAAEIDALTRERDEARMYGKLTDVAANSLNAELKECQSALRLALAGTEQHYFAIPARIDDVRAALAVAQSQLAEARAEVARRDMDIATARRTITELESERNGANAFLDEVAFILRMPPAYMGGVNGWAEAKMNGLAEARAEVERLRPAAEAWEAQAQTFRAYDAAARARAAKGAA